MKFQKYLFVALIFFGSFLLLLTEANATVATEVSMQYVSSTHQVKTVSSTHILDYQTHLYYRAGVDVLLYDEYGDEDSGVAVNDLSATVRCEVQSTYLSFHRLDAIHFLRSRSGGPVFYDPYGYSAGGEKPSLPESNPDKLKDSAKPDNDLSISTVASAEEFSPSNIPTTTSFSDYFVRRYIIDAFVGMRPHIDWFSPTGLPVGSGGPFVLRFGGLDLSPEQRSGYIPTINITGTGVTAVARPASIDYIGLDGEITVAVDAEIGDHQISITLPDLENGTITSNQLPFRVGDRTPVISSISEDQGDAGEVLQVTINGSGFGLNNLVVFEGGGIGAAIQSQTSTQIVATFAIGDTAPPGERGVKVKSLGRLGTGFVIVPGNSDTSNAVSFTVIANPSVFIPDIDSVEKGSVKTITVQVRNAPNGHVTKFRFKNKPTPVPPCPVTGCITGEARFENGTSQGALELSFTSTGSPSEDFQIPIRGWERSNERNNVDLEARFNNDPAKKKEKSFSVSSVVFTETAECNGYDNVEDMRSVTNTYLSLPRGGSNTVKAKVIPSGATGNFKLEVIGQPGISVSPSIINSTSNVTLTVSSTPTAGRNFAGIYVKANNNDTTTNIAETLIPYALKRKDKIIKIYKVKEDNDDFQAIPVGQGAPNHTAYIILNGPNGVVDTMPQGDDLIGITPYWERPPSQRRNPRLFRILTGPNGILETALQGDDGQYIPTSTAEQALYAPITVVGNGLTDAICVTRGLNDFLDTWDRNGDDQEIADPANSTLTVVSAGTNGRCQTHANNTDLRASNPPSVATIQSLLDDRWGIQANIFFTVDSNIEEIDVNYDLDRDRKLQAPNFTNNTDDDEMNAMRQSTPANTINMYWAGLDFTDVNLIGVGSPTSPHSWFADNTQGNQAKLNWVIGHEIGHTLGRFGHTSEIPSELEYQKDLMYYAFLTNATFNQCRVRREDWDLVNPDQ